jgi:hypothetical protein
LSSKGPLRDRKEGFGRWGEALSLAGDDPYQFSDSGH